MAGGSGDRADEGLVESLEFRVESFEFATLILVRGFGRIMANGLSEGEVAWN